MYTYQANDLRVQTRNGEKKPHPTLIGGDPDVLAAGTVRKNSQGYIDLNDRSGHFRIQNVNLDAQDKVDDLCGQGHIIR